MSAVVRAVALSLLLVPAALAPLSAAEAAAASSAAGQALSESVGSLGLQVELPVEREMERTTRCSGWSGGGSTAPVFSGTVATYLFYGALVVMVVIIAVTILDNLPRGPEALSAPGGGKAKPGVEAVLARMESARGDADSLAAQGYYADAMHLLLLQSLGELRLHLNISIAQSLTSREILDRISLDPQAHRALADIINRVEISYFGTHQPGEEEYRACRTSFAALTGSLRRGIAA